MSRYRSTPSHAAPRRRGVRVPPWSGRATAARHRAAGRARRGATTRTTSRHRRTAPPRAHPLGRLLPAALGVTLAAAMVSSWFAVGGAVAMAAMLR